jgi:hypothetical protein
MNTANGVDWYEVKLRVEVTLIDRHIDFVAYWPPDDEDAAAIRGRQTGFDLSSVFRPGTA